MPGEADVHVRDFRPGDQPAFKRLNLAWIASLFKIEASDLQQLDDPEGHILQVGGRIVLAEISESIVGTAALIPCHDIAGRFELAKMTVDTSVRGFGIGQKLLNAAIDTARQMDATHVWLETNSKLIAATQLYKSAGFRALTVTEMTASPYDRCDLQMRLDL